MKYDCHYLILLYLLFKMTCHIVVVHDEMISVIFLRNVCVQCGFICDIMSSTILQIKGLLMKLYVTDFFFKKKKKLYEKGFICLKAKLGNNFLVFVVSFLVLSCAIISGYLRILGLSAHFLTFLENGFVWE